MSKAQLTTYLLGALAKLFSLSELKFFYEVGRSIFHICFLEQILIKTLLRVRNCSSHIWLHKHDLSTYKGKRKTPPCWIAFIVLEDDPGGEKDTNALTWNAAMPACQARSACWFSSGIKMGGGVTNHFLLGSETGFTGRNLCLAIPDQSSWLGRSQALLRNGHVLSNCLLSICLYPEISAVLNLGQRSFIFAVGVVNVETHYWSKCWELRLFKSNPK